MSDECADSQEWGQRPEKELQEAIWTHNRELFDTVSGKELTKLAKGLDWGKFDFTQYDNEDAVFPKRGVILEEVNNTALAVLCRDGEIYQLGDRVTFECRSKMKTWGRRSKKRKITIEGHIDHVSDVHVSISREPTYSNVPGDSYSASLGRTEVEIIERSNLDKYRQRLTEGIDIPEKIPDEVNGWELVETDHRDFGEDYTTLADNIVTKMRWNNGESTNIVAQWRGGYQCWRLSTPVEGILSDKNVDEYLYEIDINHNIVTTEEIVELAVEAMEKLDPEYFQDGYDLRYPDSTSTDGPGKRKAGFVPVEIPKQIGDWELAEDKPYSRKWENTNEQSVWSDFSVKIDFQGGVTVTNEEEREVHDRRIIKKHYPNGDPYPDNVAEKQYEWQRRDMFDENWHYGVAFMIQTTKGDIEESVIALLDDQTPTNVPLERFDHQLSTDVYETMDRQNGSLLAY